MDYRQIGNTELQVSTVSLGCWTLGGPNWDKGNPSGWAEVNEDEVEEAVKYALDQGVNHFDNADVYGNGTAERRLAKVLKKLGVNSEDLVIATKIGHFSGTAAHAYDPLHIRHQCEQSLKNLERDHIDIYYFHHGNFGVGDMYLEDAVAEMNKLVDEGKVRVKGQSAYSVDHFRKLIPVVQPSVLQSWANMQSAEFILPGSELNQLMEKHDLSFVAFSPLAQGRLLDKFDPANPPEFEPGDNRKNSKAFTAGGLADLKPKLEMLKGRFGVKTEDLAAACVNFILAQPRVACAIPGFRNLAQVKCNLTAAGHDMSDGDVAFVNEIFGR
jgi:aryl-alcohol dehydrogenase-like predicted oxidoreductase